MNYYETIINKATGVAPGPEMDEIIFVMGVRFSDLSERQIASKAKRAMRDIREAREMYGYPPKNVTGTATKVLA